jgi:phosphatidate cytidylyltransferase
MLKTRILTASIMGSALLAALFLLPPAWTVVLFAAVLVVCAWEWAGFGALRNPLARAGFTFLIAVLLGGCWIWSEDPRHLKIVLQAAGAWWIVALLWLTLAPGRQNRLVSLMCGIPVLVPAFIALARLQLASRGLARGPEIVLWLVLLVCSADIGAYFAGRAWGRHKLAPRVSPGKTWEGAAGGLAAVMLVAVAGALHFDIALSDGLVFGAVVGIFSVIGDLTESMFKRAAGLKDSGSVLPGHGGILDRLDSVTAAAPIYALGLFSWGVIE